MGAHNTDIAGQGHVTDPIHHESRLYPLEDEAFYYYSDDSDEPPWER